MSELNIKYMKKLKKGQTTRRLYVPLHQISTRMPILLLIS